MQEILTDVDQSISLDERRAFLQLPVKERRRQLAAQAERMLQYCDPRLSA